MGENPLRVGIVGSRKYENRKKIKDFIFKLKNEKGTDTIIVSGGCKTGADRYAKKYALELGLQYQEFPPFHENWNIYCPKDQKDYGKPSINKTMKAFTEFREAIFDEKGNHRTDRDYAAKPGSACKFCEFYDTEHCKWGKIL